MSGKSAWMVIRAWEKALKNPGKKVAVVMSEGTMVLEFKPHGDTYSGFEISEIEIDGVKHNG
jgi:hypothetical protein